jgi:hypothetical protein
MKRKAKNKQKKLKIRGVAIVIAFAIVLGTGAYLGDYCRADNGLICFEPEEPSSGLIFYPGGKVQYEAYAPLLEMMAENGILCVLVHMPGSLLHSRFVG